MTELEESEDSLYSFLQERDIEVVHSMKELERKKIDINSLTSLCKNEKGNINITRYESESNPETITTRSKGNEDPLGFYGRICLRLKSMAKSLGHIPALEDGK